MARKSLRHPDLPVSHPGEHIREDVIPALRMSKTAIAAALGVSRQTLYDLIDEKQGVTASMALRLETAIGGSAEFWLRRQASHDLWKARRTLDVSKLKRLREPADETLEAAE